MQSFVLLDCTATTGVLLIEAASRLNYRPVVVTADERSYERDEFAGAEVVEVTPWTEEGIMAVVSQVGAAGVYTCIDRHLETVRNVACRLGLPTQTYASILYGRDKRLQRAWLRSTVGDRTEAITCTNLSDALDAAAVLGFPVVLKPVDQAGSVGTRYCTCAADIQDGIRQIMTLARLEKRPQVALVEKYIDGQQYSVEVFSGKIVGYVRQFYTPPPAFIAVGHQFPAALTPGRLSELENLSRQVIDSFGLSFGPAHIEVRLPSDGGEPVLIECNARIAGAAVPQLIQETCGVDLAQLTVLAFTGMPHNVPTADAGGKLGLLGFLHATSSGCVAEVTRSVNPNICVYVKEGDRLSAARDYRNRVGHGIAVGGSLDEARSRLFARLGEVSVRDEIGSTLAGVYETLGS